VGDEACDWVRQVADPTLFAAKREEGSRPGVVSGRSSGHEQRSLASLKVEMTERERGKKAADDGLADGIRNRLAWHISTFAKPLPFPCKFHPYPYLSSGRQIMMA
jgi:hypothetical protein